MSNNGRSNGKENGSPHVQPQPPIPSEATFVEDSEGVTISTGLLEARFNALRGGRLESWQWRTTPPPDALNPATRHDPPRLLTLLDSPHGALVDHFLPLGTKMEEFYAGTYREFGDFVEEPFTQQVIDLGGEIRVAYRRDGSIKAGKREAELRLMKSIGVRPRSNDLSALYRVINSSLRPLQILFAIEYNLFAPDLAEHPDASQSAYYLIDGVQPQSPPLTSTGVSPAATSVTLANPTSEVALQLGWDRECDLWRMPSPSATPGAVRLIAVWRLSLPPRDNWALGLWLAPS
jgi:hypothetical protein